MKTLVLSALRHPPLMVFFLDLKECMEALSILKLS